MNRGVPIWVQIILPAEVPATAPVLWEADSKEEGKVPKVHPDWMGLSGECCCSDFAQKNPIKTDRTHDQLYKKWGWKPGWYPCAALPICLGLKLEIAALICSASSGIFFVQFLKSVLWVCTWIAIKTYKNNLIFICSNPSWHWPLQLWPRLFHHNGIPVYRIPRFMKKEQCHCDFGFKIGGLASAVGEGYTVHSHVMGNFTTIQY